MRGLQRQIRSHVVVELELTRGDRPTMKITGALIFSGLQRW